MQKVKDGEVHKVKADVTREDRRNKSWNWRL